jgi:hypothetical protein
VRTLRGGSRVVPGSEEIQHLGQLGEGGPLPRVVRPAGRQDLLGREERETGSEPPGGTQAWAGSLYHENDLNQGLSMQDIMLRLKVQDTRDSGVVDEAVLGFGTIVHYKTKQ